MSESVGSVLDNEFCVSGIPKGAACLGNDASGADAQISQLGGACPGVWSIGRRAGLDGHAEEPGGSAWFPSSSCWFCVDGQ